MYTIVVKLGDDDAIAFVAAAAAAAVQNGRAA